MTPPIVLAYSGGLKASAAIPWLAETYGAAVVAVALDLGQHDNLVEVRDRALASGALRCHVFDARELFARDYIVPALKAQAQSDSGYPMATALGRPLIAEQLVEIARLEQATTVAHASAGRDRVRLDGPLRALDPALEVIAVAETWDLTAAEVADYAERHGVPGGSPDADAPRADRNLWGRTSGRPVGDAWQAPSEDAYVLTRALDRTPDHPAAVDLTFDRGTPVMINGIPMGPVELIESLSTIAAEHGVGRLDRIKTGADGRSTRVTYEAPAAVVLHQAHSDLASSVAAGRLTRVTQSVARAYADVIDGGEWHSPLHRALDGFVGSVQERVTGVVRLQLFKGACRVVGRSSPHLTAPVV